MSLLSDLIKYFTLGWLYYLALWSERGKWLASRVPASLTVLCCSWSSSERTSYSIVEFQPTGSLLHVQAVRGLRVLQNLRWKCRVALQASDSPELRAIRCRDGSPSFDRHSAGSSHFGWSRGVHIPLLRATLRDWNLMQLGAEGGNSRRQRRIAGLPVQAIAYGALELEAVRRSVLTAPSC